MKARTSQLRLAPMSLAVIAAGCAGSAAPQLPAGPRRSAKLDGVAWSLTERAHDGTFAVPTDGATVAVDANSRLVVSFAVEPAEQLASAGAEWQTVADGLAQVRTLLADGPMLDAADVDERDARAVADLSGRLQQHYRRLRAFAAGFRTTIEQHRPDLHVDRILDGSFDGQDRSPLPNAARWLAGELERLRLVAAARTAGREQVRVVVQAYHEPVAGERQPIHVDNYDRLPVGELRPVPRMGLAMTPQERSRLDAEIAASKAAAATIRELQKNGRDVLRGVADYAGKLRRSLATLAEAVRKAPDWQQKLAAATAPLQNLATSSGDPAVQAAARDLAQALPALQTQLAQLAAAGATRQLLEEVAGRLRDGEPQAVFAAIGDLGTVVESDLAAAVEALGEPAQQVASALQVLGSRLAAGDLQAVLPQTTRELLTMLTTELPTTIAFATFVRDYVAGAAQRRTVAEVLAKSRDVAIPRPLDDLPDGTIDLTRAGVALDDHVGVHVRFENATAGAADPAGPGDPIEETSVDTEMVLTGLYRRIRGQLIFARADHGTADATRWQANVAALADWHYRYRDAAVSDWAAFWNFVDLGFGVHVASLDHNDDTAEVGLGVNLSLFGGFVSGGYGYNLSTPDGNGQYYFVGIDLLDVLRQAGSGVTAR